MENDKVRSDIMLLKECEIILMSVYDGIQHHDIVKFTLGKTILTLRESREYYREYLAHDKNL